MRNRIRKIKFRKKNIKEHELRGFYRIFCWCSGARLYLLKKCPTDYNVFFGMGIIVFLTGTMAFLSGSYAFYTVFDNVYLSVAFGLFWGVFIFFFDWYLVASLRKEKKFFRELLTASPRIILAFFLAVVISRPLELKLFESEINSKLETLNQEKYNNYLGVVGTGFEEINILTEQNKKYEKTINDLLEKRNALFELIVAEAEGRSPTAKVGKGAVYREKKAEYNKINKIYEEEKSRLYPLIEANNKQLAVLKAKRDKQLAGGEVSVKQATGFLARLNAYNSLAQESRTIKIAGWFILFLFVSIETGPMFVKLISRRGAYDELLTLEEARLVANSKQELTQITEKTKRIVEIEKQKSNARIEREVENSNDFTQQIMEAQSEIGKERIKKWKEHELKKMDAGFDNYKPTIDELIDDARVAMKPN